MSLSASVISVILVWSGDYQSRLQFNGPFNQELLGQTLSESEKSPCEVYARFKEVTKKEKSNLGQFLQIKFKFVCAEDGQKRTYALAEEYIKIPDLKTSSSQIVISQKYKNNQLKIEDYSVQVSKPSPSTK